MSGLGLAYWAVTDHSKASFQANGLDEARVEKQLKEIATVNQKLEDDGNAFRLLSGIEVDVLKKGLDFEDDLLAQLEVVVASLHVAGSDEKDNTKRLIAAAENPYVHMLGHLSGRLLLERAPQSLTNKPSSTPAPRQVPGLSSTPIPTASILTGVIGNTPKAAV